MILKPPIKTEVQGPLVFLAGPIQGTSDWQSEAILYLQKKSSAIHIACPRHNYPPGEFDYETQVNWETHHLRRAAEQGVILFWLACETVQIPGRSYAQTTRFELAEWKVRHERNGIKIVIGIEAGFSGARYIRQRFSQDCPNIPIVDSIESACDSALQLLSTIE